jgi:hypothetical protein
MRGLIKITQSLQTQAAQRDWEFAKNFAKANGLETQANKLDPAQGWGWRRIDKSIGALREILRENGTELPSLPSRGD